MIMTFKTELRSLVQFRFEQNMSFHARQDGENERNVNKRKKSYLHWYFRGFYLKQTGIQI